MTGTDLRLPRLILVSFWGAVCAAIVAAPLLASSAPVASGVLYLFFAPVCHQEPARSFALWGHQLAVCHRCSGIYLGLLMASLLPAGVYRVGGIPRLRQGIAGAATAALVLDASLPFAGLWNNTPATRFFTGLAFGAMLSLLLVPGLAEYLRGVRWIPLRIRAHHLGGI